MLRGDATAPILGIPYCIYAFSVGFSLGPSLRELRLSRSLETIKALVQERTGIFWLVETLPNVRRTIRDASSIVLFELCRTLDESPV